MNVRTMIALACASAAMLCCAHQADAAFIGLQLVHHAEVETPAGPKRVYRVYARFTNGADRVTLWGGTSSFPAVIKTQTCAGVLGSNFYNPGGSGGNTAPYLEDIEFAPHREWDTFATIGVAIADHGSGGGDGTTTSIGFPNFINGNSVTLNNNGVFLVGSDPESTAQGRADYAGDGDPELRVLLMQLTTNPNEFVSVTVGDLQYAAAGGPTQVVNNQTTDILDAIGSCCLPEGGCTVTTAASCATFLQGTFIGCDPCASCPPPPPPPCLGDLAPEGKGDGTVNVDDLLVLLAAWGKCAPPPPQCDADLAPEPNGDGTVNVDDLLALLGAWGDC